MTWPSILSEYYQINNNNDNNFTVHALSLRYSVGTNALIHLALNFILILSPSIYFPKLFVIKWSTYLPWYLTPLTVLELCTPTAWYNMQPFFSIRELPCSRRHCPPWIGWIGVLLSYTSISPDQIPSSADVSTIITTCSLSKYGYAIPKLSPRTNVARVNNTARNV